MARPANDPLSLGLSKRPLMGILVGANGSGKSTLYDLVIGPRLPLTPFINADLIQREELGDARPEASYKAARMADERRALALSEGRSFITETVFSHPSKLELIAAAKHAGHNVILFHIGLDSAARNVARVALRVAKGGHAVPENKTRERRERGGPLIVAAAKMADHAFVYDNSVLGRAPVLGLEVRAGRVIACEGLTPWQRTLYTL